MLFSFIIIVLICHYLGDWAFQTRYMADNKSKKWEALLAHLSVYTLFMWIASGIFMFINHEFAASYFWPLLLWTFTNVIIHGIVDRITSKFTSKFYTQGRIRAFFNVIGFDGLIHYLTLFITAKYMLNF